MILLPCLRPALGSINRTTQWVPGVFIPWVKQTVREADHLTTSSAKVGTIPPLPNTSSRRCA